MKQRSGLFWIPTLILASALLGGLFSPRVGVAAASSDDEIKESFRVFSKVLDTVERNYADKVDSEAAIFQGAIPQMLAVLDPHSQFFDPESFKRLREDQRGKYAGVGMTISSRNNQTVVVHPFPKTPAYRAGLRPGDIIVEVDGAKMDGLNTTEVANRLRGAEGTQVEIAYERPGREGLTRVTVTRDTIPRPSVPVSFNIKPHVGFVKVESFNETTGDELDAAIEKMGEKDLEGLILDLRDNRGGLLSQGVRVSEKFLDRGQTIVSHHGRASSERTYKAQRGTELPKIPVVVLVNCHSASASEIVAGALQDHDRALIIGANTFGKGLVQTVIPVGDETALALTTARYYTPSGRLIQRRYDGVSMVEYYNDPCSDHFKPNHEEVRTTDHGRRVYGGGGIAPDIVLDEQKLNDFEILLARRFAFENFAQHYTLDRPNMAPGWEPTDEAIKEFHDFLKKEEIEFTDADFNANIDFVKRFLKRAVYISAYDVDEGEKVYYALDPDVEKALEALPQAKALLSSPGSVVAEKR
ncbi:MAG: S41 family peptidase [Bryobacterales bacterium]